MFRLLWIPISKKHQNCYSCASYTCGTSDNQALGGHPWPRHAVQQNYFPTKPCNWSGRRLVTSAPWLKALALCWSCPSLCALLALRLHFVKVCWKPWRYWHLVWCLLWSLCLEGVQGDTAIYCNYCVHDECRVCLPRCNCAGHQHVVDQARSILYVQDSLRCSEHTLLAVLDSLLLAARGRLAQRLASMMRPCSFSNLLCSCASIVKTVERPWILFGWHCSMQKLMPNKGFIKLGLLPPASHTFGRSSGPALPVVWLAHAARWFSQTMSTSLSVSGTVGCYASRCDIWYLSHKTVVATSSFL